ncbi:nicotinate (nicotinamide) nucleotide adenylyltransferase [bacterium]|nr:MAG: nicotinate (nicotinamide) nucleotide adenylyltransferase [bacterium]
MHIAVFGGTFNPIHFAHLRIAEEVRERLSPEKVLFVPAFIPPHKDADTAAPATRRLEMVRLAIAGNPAFEASDIELRRLGVSYTIDTVRELKTSNAGLSISLIVGSDSFNSITTWRDFDGLIKEASFVVVPRPGNAVLQPSEALPVELAEKFWYDAVKGAYCNQYGTGVIYLETTLMDISSSGIRKRFMEGRSAKYLLPYNVIEYILGHGLYKK